MAIRCDSQLIFRGRDIDLLFAQVTMMKGKEFLNDINNITSEMPIIGTNHPFHHRQCSYESIASTNHFFQPFQRSFDDTEQIFHFQECCS